MKFNVEVKAMLKAAQAMAKAAPARAPRPVLAYVKLVADAGHVRMHATNLETALSLAVKADVLESGAALVNAKQFAAVVKGAKSGVITVERPEDHFGQITITTAAGLAVQLTGADPADFPELPPIYSGPCVTVQAANMIQALDETIFATAREQARYALNGILFKAVPRPVDDGGPMVEYLTLCSTDGKRLSLTKCECTSSAGFEKIIPTGAAQLLRAMLKTAAAVRILLSDDADNSAIQFETDTFRIDSRLVEGHFPTYEDVIPAAADQERAFVIDGPALAAAIEHMRPVLTEESQAVRFQLRDDGLALAASNLEGQKARVDLPGRLTGEQFDIAFNPDFIADVLKVYGPRDVIFSFKDNTSAAIITAAGSALTYVVMPVHIELTAEEARAALAANEAAVEAAAQAKAVAKSIRRHAQVVDKRKLAAVNAQIKAAAREQAAAAPAVDPVFDPAACQKCGNPEIIVSRPMRSQLWQKLCVKCAHSWLYDSATGQNVEKDAARESAAAVPAVVPVADGISAEELSWLNATLDEIQAQAAAELTQSRKAARADKLLPTDAEVDAFAYAMAG